MSTVAIKERPILFSGAMVRALLAGTKTQTRRAAKHPLAQAAARIISYHGQSEFDCILPDETGGIILCPYGQPGDRLWVRESCAFLGERLLKSEGVPGYLYRADSNEFDGHGIAWKPSIHMPRGACRLLLEIVSVRVERVQALSEADAVAEGVRVVESFKNAPHYENYLNQWAFEYTAVDSYATLWEKINGLGSWALNPWVWVVEFKVLEGGARG